MADKDPRRREIFVNIPAVRPSIEQSFEELRMTDYVKAYQTTGRPPQSCPTNPTDRNERTRLGLPQHFEPYIEIGGYPVPEQSPATTITLLSVPLAGPPPRDIDVLPDVQVFQSAFDTSESGNKVFLQSIVAQHIFSTFSPEELRCKAYSIGKIFVPEIVDLSAPTDEGSLQCITARLAHSKHSFEELRVACMRASRELTSDEIIQMHILG